MSGQERRHLHSVDEIAEMLRARMLDLVEAWQLQGQVDGNDFVCCNPLRADRKAGSFRICVRGSHAGLIKDFASGERWSALGFTAQLWFRGDQVEAIKWAKGWLGLDGTDPDALKKTRRAVEVAAERVAEADDQAEQKRRRAYARFLEATADVKGTPVERYLLGRGLDLGRLPFPTGAIRYHPSLWNQESGRRWPAMVAPIVGADGRFLAAHRTWLDVRSDGHVTKAPLDRPKKVLGRYAGGTIRLWHGLRVDPKTGEIRKGVPLAKAKPGAWVDMTEGIEDGLTVAIAEPELRILVGVSVSNWGSIKLPDQVEGVCLWRQRDPPGSEAERGFNRVVENFVNQGKRVRLVLPPEGAKDANEVVQQGAGEQDMRERQA
jgi:hypothetical protein